MYAFSVAWDLKLLLGSDQASRKTWVDLTAYEESHSRFQWQVVRLGLVGLAAAKISVLLVLAAFLRIFGRNIVLLRADTMGTLVTTTSLWISDAKSQTWSKQTHVLPLTWVCNVEIWNRFSKCNTKLNFLSNTTCLKALSWLGNAHNGYSIAIHRYLFERYSVIRRLLWSPEYDYGGLEFAARVAVDMQFPLKDSVESHEIEDLRERLGVEANQKLMLIVDRDSGTGISGNLRNTPRGAVEAIAELLLEREWFVVRAGRVRSERIALSSADWVDYPFSTLCSDKNDLLLAAASNAAIGWNTGLTDLPICLGKPTLLFTNFVPRAMPNVLNSLSFTRSSQSDQLVPAWDLGLVGEASTYRDLTRGLMAIDDPDLMAQVGVTMEVPSTGELVQEVQEFLDVLDHAGRWSESPASLISSLNGHALTNLSTHGEDRYSPFNVFITKQSRSTWLSP